MSNKYSSVFAVISSHGIMHSYLVILPALLPLVKVDLGNIETVGLLASLVFLFYGWGSLPAGVLADKYPRRFLITASMGLCGFSSILVGLSWNLLTAALGFILLGVGASLYHPPGYTLISLISTEMKRGRYMGLQGLGGEIGMASAYFTSPILGVLLGWRITFMLWGILGMLMAIIDFIMIEEDEPACKDVDLRSRSGISRRGMLPDESVKFLVVVFIIVICSGALWNGVSSFILTYINEAKRIQLIIAGGLSTISYTVGALAQVIGGELSDKYGRRIFLQAGFLSFAIFLFLLTVIPSSILLVLFIVSMLGFTFYITQSPLNALLGDVSPRGTVGVAYGFNFVIKFGIGGVSPAIAGFLARSYSMNHIFYFFALIAAVAFISSLAVKNTGDKHA